MSNRYYISTGDKNCFYTLRYEFDDVAGDGQGGTRLITRDYYVCNLSTDRDEAIAKARSRAGDELNLDVSFDLSKIVRRSEIDWSVFQAGKYAGKSIHEVKEIDPAYLCWVCENCAHSKGYKGTVDLANALVAQELAQRAQDRQDKANAEKSKQSAISELLSPLAANLRDGKGGFCDSIATDLESGKIPQGRAEAIVIDILAKQYGRRNSAAYNAGYNSVAALFDQARLIESPRVIFCHIG